MPTDLILDPKIKALEQVFHQHLASLDNTNTDEKPSLEKFQHSQYIPTNKSKQNLLLFNFYSRLIEIIETSIQAKKAKKQATLYVDDLVMQLYVALADIQKDKSVWKYILTEKIGRDALYYILLINMMYVSFKIETCKKIIVNLLKKATCEIERKILRHLEHILGVSTPLTCKELTTTQQKNPEILVHAYCHSINDEINVEQLEKNPHHESNVLKYLLELLENNNACALITQMTIHADHLSEYFAVVKTLAAKSYLPYTLSNIEGDEPATAFTYISRLYQHLHVFKTKYALAFKSEILLSEIQYTALIQLSICLYGCISDQMDTHKLTAPLKQNLLFLKKKDKLIIDGNEFILFWKGYARLSANDQEETPSNQSAHQALYAALNFLTDFSCPKKIKSPLNQRENFRRILNTFNNKQYKTDKLTLDFMEKNYGKIIGHLKLKHLNAVQQTQEEFLYFSETEPKLMSKFIDKLLSIHACFESNTKMRENYKKIFTIKNITRTEDETNDTCPSEEKKSEQKNQPVITIFHPHHLYITAENTLIDHLNAIDDNINQLQTKPIQLEKNQHHTSAYDELDQSNRLLITIIINVIAIIEIAQKSRHPNFQISEKKLEGMNINENKPETSHTKIIEIISCLEKNLANLHANHYDLWQIFIKRKASIYALSYAIFINPNNSDETNDLSTKWRRDFTSSIPKIDEFDIVNFALFLHGANKKKLSSYTLDMVNYVKGKMLKLFLILKFYDPKNPTVIEHLNHLLQNPLSENMSLPLCLINLVKLYLYHQFILIMDRYTDNPKLLLQLENQLKEKNYFIKQNHSHTPSRKKMKSYLFTSTYHFYLYLVVFKINHTPPLNSINNLIAEICNSALTNTIYITHTLDNFYHLEYKIIKDLIVDILKYLRNENFELTTHTSYFFWPNLIKMLLHISTQSQQPRQTNPIITSFSNPLFEGTINSLLDNFFSRNKGKEARILLESYNIEKAQQYSTTDEEQKNNYTSQTNYRYTYHDDLWWLMSFIKKLPKSIDIEKCNRKFIDCLDSQDRNYYQIHINNINDHLFKEFKHAKEFLLKKLIKKMAKLIEFSAHFNKLLLSTASITPLLETVLKLSVKLGMSESTWNIIKAEFIELYDFVDTLDYTSLAQTDTRTLSPITSQKQNDAPITLDIEAPPIIEESMTDLTQTNASIPDLVNVVETDTIISQEDSVPPPTEADFHDKIQETEIKQAAINTPLISDNIIRLPFPKASKEIKFSILNSFALFKPKNNYSIVIEKQRIPTSLLNFSKFIHQLTGQFLTIMGGAARAYYKKMDHLIHDHDAVIFYPLESLIKQLEENSDLKFYCERRGLAYPIIHVILVEGDYVDCDLIYLPHSTRTDFSNYKTESPAAYIITQNNIYYINKQKNICIEIKIHEDSPTNSAANRNMRKSFNARMITKDKTRILTLSELQYITRLTHHAHASLLELDISCYPYQEHIYEYLMKKVALQRDLKQSILYFQLRGDENIFIIKDHLNALWATENNLIIAVNTDTLFKNPSDFLRIFRIIKSQLEEPLNQCDTNMLITLNSTNFNFFVKKLIFSEQINPNINLDNSADITHLRQINTQLSELLIRFNHEEVIKKLCDFYVMTSLFGFMDHKLIHITQDILSTYLKSLSVDHQITGLYHYIAILYHLAPNQYHQKSILMKMQAALPPKEALDFQNHIDHIKKNTSNRMQPKSTFTPNPEFSTFLLEMKLRINAHSHIDEVKLDYSKPRFGR